LGSTLRATIDCSAVHDVRGRTTTGSDAVVRHGAGAHPAFTTTSKMS